MREPSMQTGRVDSLVLAVDLCRVGIVPTDCVLSLRQLVWPSWSSVGMCHAAVEIYSGRFNKGAVSQSPPVGMRM